MVASVTTVEWVGHGQVFVVVVVLFLLSSPDFLADNFDQGALLEKGLSVAWLEYVCPNDIAGESESPQQKATEGQRDVLQVKLRGQWHGCAHAITNEGGGRGTEIDRISKELMVIAFEEKKLVLVSTL